MTNYINWPLWQPEPTFTWPTFPITEDERATSNDVRKFVAIVDKDTSCDQASAGLGPMRCSQSTIAKRRKANKLARKARRQK